jgi:hypothetical protein
LGRNYFPGALPQASDECRAVGANRVQSRRPRMPSKCAPWHNSVSPNASAPSRAINFGKLLRRWRLS